MMVMGTPIAVSKAQLRKKHPIGTPALPMAAIVAMPTHNNLSKVVKVTPWFSATNRTVTNIKAAHAFILMLVQSGKVNLLTWVFTPQVWLHSMAKGIAATDDLEKNASDKAGTIALKAINGDMPFFLSIRGKLMKA